VEAASVDGILAARGSVVSSRIATPRRRAALWLRSLNVRFLFCGPQQGAEHGRLAQVGGQPLAYFLLAWDAIDEIVRTCGHSITSVEHRDDFGIRSPTTASELCPETV
jgi:hypothetical protein